MARLSYYLSGELIIDSDLSVQELERLLEDVMAVSQKDARVTPVNIGLSAPRRA